MGDGKWSRWVCRAPCGLAQHLSATSHIETRLGNRFSLSRVRAFRGVKGGCGDVGMSDGEGGLSRQGGAEKWREQ